MEAATVGENSQRREKVSGKKIRKRKSQRRESIRRKKIKARKKVEKSRETRCFSNVLWLRRVEKLAC